MLLSCADEGLSGLSWLQFDDIGAFAAPLAERGSLQGKLSGTMVRLDVFQTIAVGEDVTFGSCKPQEDLTRCRFASRSVHDFDLPFLNEVIILHDGVHAFDAVGNIDQACLVRGVKHHAMMLLVDTEIGHLANPVGYFGAQYHRPQFEIVLDRAAAQPDTLQPGDSGVTAREIAAAALGGPQHQIDFVAGGVLDDQRATYEALGTLVRGGFAPQKSVAGQGLRDAIEFRLT